MVNPASIIVLGIINAFRRNNNNNHQHSPDHHHQHPHQQGTSSNQYLSNNDYMNYFLSYSGLILGTGTVMLTTLGISYYFNTKPYTYLRSLRFLNNKTTIEVTGSNLYESKYFDEYDGYIERKRNETANEKEIYQDENKQHIQECLDNMYYSTITDFINETYGTIIMCYDHATQSFAYYAKTANIPYKYLETAARKYVIDTNAPEDLYVDIRKEYENASNKINNRINKKISSSTKEDKEEAKEEAKEEDENIFATFKSYNKATNIPVSEIHNTKDTSTKTPLEESVLSSFTKSSNPSTSSSAPILRERANRYSYRGKLTDFETHHATFLSNRRKSKNIEIVNNNNNNDTELLSYQEYKKRQHKNKVE